MSTVSPVYGIVYMTCRMRRGKAVRFYIGQHKLTGGVLEDGYIGSGKLLRQAVEKYGPECFVRRVLESCYDRKMLDLAEIKWIKHYDAVNDRRFYNLADGGKSVFSIKRKAVYQYSLSGEFIAEYASVAEAAAVAGCSEAQMTLSCRLSGRTAKGFQWTFTKTDSLPEIGAGVKKVVSCYSMRGEFVRSFDSLTEGAKFVGQRTTSNIAACCRGKKKSCGGYLWQYLTPESSIAVTSLQRNTTAIQCIKLDRLTGDVLAVFDSVTSAAASVGASPGNISRSVRSGYLCAGFKWRLN